MERFDAKSFEQHLEERSHRPQQDAIEFAFDNVVVSELVDVHAEDVEQAEGNQREAVEEKRFLEPPAGQPRNSTEQDQQETESAQRGGNAGGQANQEVGAIADAHFDVLREISSQQPEMPAHISLRGW